MNFIINFLVNNFSSCVWLLTILVALVPTLESKIAIPLAINSAIWGAKALSPLNAFMLGFIGSIIPCFFIMFLSRKLKDKTTSFFVNKKYMFKANKIGKSEGLKKYILLTTFIAIPLPLTGVWSGSIIAGLTNLDMKYSFLSILIGALISSGITTLLCCFFENSVTAILIISILIIIIFMIADFIISYWPRAKKNIKD